MKCYYQKKEIQHEKSPAFFTDNKTLLLAINHQIKAVEKTITFLRAGSERNIQFTSEEIVILDKGFIGDTLDKFFIILPSGSSQQPGL